MSRPDIRHGDAAHLGVVVPARNAAETIAATLLGLRSLVNIGTRVIVVDGCSTDGTAALAESLGFEVIRRPCSLYEAIDIGFAELDREWLTWINADDILYAEGIPQRLGEAGDADLLYGPVDFIDSQGRFLHCWHSAAPRDLLTLYRAGYSPLLQQGTLFRRSLYVRADGFRQTYSLVADADFWYRCLELGARCKRIRHPPVAAFRLHGDQLSRRNADEMVTQHAAMTVANGGRCDPLAAGIALARFRTANWPSYLIRSLRRVDLEGRIRLPGSYELPPRRC